MQLFSCGEWWSSRSVVGTRFSGLASERQPTSSFFKVEFHKAYILRKVFWWEIIYRSIYCYLKVQTKLWQGIFVFEVIIIFSLNIEHSKNKSICKGTEISSIQRTNLSLKGKKYWNLMATLSQTWCSCLCIVCSVIKEWLDMFVCGIFIIHFIYIRIDLNSGQKLYSQSFAHL